MSSEKPKVLIVEDHEINQMIIQTMVKNLGCDSDIAGDGQIAVDLCRKNSYDLIFMDLQMPNMDGFDATIILRNELNLRIPIYAVTADAYPEDMERCTKVGMDGVILKPYRQEQLAEIISQLKG